MGLNDELIKQLNLEHEHFFEASKEESDRGVALVAVEYFDATLERLLLARFAAGLKERPKLIKPLFEGFGPLSTFSSKISLSYAFDLLQTWMASDLDAIRRIRNEFAHSLESRTFRDPKISSMVNQLACVSQVKQELDKLEKQIVPLGGPSMATAESTRAKFIVACSRMGALLQAKVIVMESDAADEMKRGFMTTPEL